MKTTPNQKHLDDLKSRQLDILLNRLHRPTYRNLIAFGRTKRAEEVRQLVLRVYGIDLATEAR